jgi:hypothetical protein
MNITLPPILRRVTRWNLLFLALIACVAVVWFPVQGRLQAGLQQEQLESIAPAEFSRLIQGLSEEDGYFRSENFTSNETSYLNVVGKLRELQVSGGAYLGVGPEQNFTYIAKVRPRIAFIVDIRRQAMIQHLLYKAVFQTSENRAEFLSSLLCRPLSGKTAPGREASVERLLAHFASDAVPDAIFASNLARVRNIIQRQFHFSLSESDQERLKHVYSTFHKEGLGISFRSNSPSWGGYGGFPSLKDLVLQPDLKGNLGNFLASEEDYRFVRNLHLKNRIIPVVGDFAGPKALAAVGGYLRRNGYTVRAFYTSNVEQFLFQNAVFGAFVENVRKLPIDTGSVFIRAVSSRGQPHPAHVPGHRTTTVLQKISVFLKDYDDGAYSDYRDMVTTHFIAGQ